MDIVSLGEVLFHKIHKLFRIFYAGLMLPTGFLSGFIVDISQAGIFICRADLGSEITRQKPNTRRIFRYCASEPVRRISSVAENIVIDSSAAMLKQNVRD
jgi:hypothetical protein